MARLQAFFQLAMLRNNTLHGSIPLLVPLIERILFGTTTPPNCSCAPTAHGAVPTTETLIAKYDLSQAKELARGLSKGLSDSAPQRKGRGLVIDFLDSSQARESASSMVNAGLSTRTMFNTNQCTGFSCGHNSAAWAVMLRTMGNNFQDLPMETAAAINTRAYVTATNLRLGKAAASVDWLTGDILTLLNAISRSTRSPGREHPSPWRMLSLTGDDIVRLVKMDNPDAPNTEPMWLSGPAPLNYFYSFFHTTLVTPKYFGKVHIMVVNVENDQGFSGGPSTSAASSYGGSHWFIAAWFVQP